MIVTRESFCLIVQELKKENTLALDTETLGLRPYHGDTLFSLIISSCHDNFYFNFKFYPGEIEDNQFLSKTSLDVLQRELFNDTSKTWFIQNSCNFDMQVLAQENIELKGTIHCTKAIGRIEYNAFSSYSLEDQAKRIGLAKDDAVMNYITEHKLYDKVSVPGKEKKVKNLHFDKVPFDIISKYGEMDGEVTYKLGMRQMLSIHEKDINEPELYRANRTLIRVMTNERRLQKTIFRMKHVGVRIDKPYCERAIKYENNLYELAAKEFQTEAGVPYKASPSLFAEIFKEEKDNWTYTEKGNSSFDFAAIQKLKHPAAKCIVRMRDAKAKSDFYQGFLYHADNNGDIHPNYNPEGTVHGRFSSSEPNFQNLTSEEDEETLAGEFVVRRAIIPRPGYVFIMPDYDQMEYKFMLEQALILQGAMTPLGQMVLDGFDFHDATVTNVKNKAGIDIVRKTAKIANFLTLYGGGAEKLAKEVGCTVEEAADIRYAIFSAAPEIRTYIKAVMEAAEKRGWIVNWMGRRCYFPNKDYAYRAPNYHVSGGCADICKVAMNMIDQALLPFKSRMVMTIHDELPTEIHESELKTAPYLIKDLMDSAYRSRYIPLTNRMEWSDKSLGDKKKGFPV